MPGLITKYQKQVAVTHLKKAYVTISEAVKLSEIENGSAKNWEYPETYQPAQLLMFYNKYLEKYIRTTKQVNVGGGGITVKLVDGTELDLYSLNERLEFYVIIPNIQKNTVKGKNMFYFAIYKPTGEIKLDGQGASRDDLLNHSRYGCKRASRNWCTALIQIDGWEIKDDYPWDEL